MIMTVKDPAVPGPQVCASTVTPAHAPRPLPLPLAARPQVGGPEPVIATPVGPLTPRRPWMPNQNLPTRPTPLSPSGRRALAATMLAGVVLQVVIVPHV